MTFFFKHKPVEAVLFDLDGTLIDTAPDFIRIIQQMSDELGIERPTAHDIRLQVSEGARAMTQLMYPDLSIDDPILLGHRTEFLARYAQHIAVETQLFDGMNDFLIYLENNAIPWGIVTNKPRHLSVALLEALNLSTRCAVLVCPDDVSKPKPDAEPMLLASQQLGIDPTKIVYVGDHPRDIDAGINANMPTILASYGYLPLARRDDLDSWHADAIIHTPETLMMLISTHAV